MQSVRLQELQSQAVHRLSLKKLPFTVVHKPGQVPAAHGKTQGSAGGQPDGPQHAEQQQQNIEGLVGGDGAEEGGDAARRGPAEQQQQQDSGSRDGGSMGAERDDGLSSEDDSEGRQQGGSNGEDGEEAEDAAGGSDEEGEEAGALDAFPPATTAAVDAFAAMIEADPAAFLQPTAELAELAKGAAKALYDYQAGLHAGSSGDGTAGPAAVLPELYIEGFDAEQIWLQLELAAGPALKRARKLLKKAGREPELLTPETEEAIDELLEGASDEEPLPGSDDEEDSEEQDADVAGVADLADLDYDALLAAGAAYQREAAGLGSDDEEEQVDGAAAVQLAGSKRKRSAAAAAARAAVEDDLFKLDEMEAFLEQAEREAEGFDDDVKEGDGEPGSDDEEAALESLLDEAAAKTNRDKKKAKKARKSKRLTFGEGQDDDDEAENIGAAAMYEDFFGPRRGGQQGPTTVAAGGKHQFEEEDAQEEGSQEEDEEEDEDGFEDDLLSDDMLSGEEGEGEENGRPHGLANGGAAGEYSDEEGEDMEDGDEEEEAGGQAAVLGSRRALLAASDEDEDKEGELGPSAHERRQQRMRDKIKKLEEAALGEKEWFMRGEIDAGHRPKNSALEVDLDFETTVKPPPQPTEEMTQTLDELIKRRIAEARFDDVVRVVAPPPETKRTTLELDDSKPQQGLGEIYEQEYMQTVAGVADDKDEEVRQAARAQFSALCTKLDALSHLHFTPRPVIEEVTVKVYVPAIMMEDAAPQFVSGASMRAPEEVFASEAAGAPRAEEELSREDRKRQRAQRKRSGKKRRAAKEEERAARAISQGGTAALANRRSAAAEEAARKLEKAAKKGRRADTSRKGEYTKSTNVFSKIQQHADGTAALGAPGPAPRAAHLKL